MHTEVETKILEIEVSTITATLEKIGAKKVGEARQQRYVYDFDPVRPNERIRLRTNGVKTTLAIKKIVTDNVDGTQELETEVGNFETTNQILQKLGYTYRSYQENDRVSYVFGNVEIEIDTWPMIPSYIEIEGPDEMSVERVVSLLGYTMDDTTSINTKKVYERYGIDIMGIDELRFS